MKKGIIIILLLVSIILIGSALIQNKVKKVDIASNVNMDLDEGIENQEDEMVENLKFEDADELEVKEEIEIEENIVELKPEIKISLVGDMLFDGHIRNHIAEYGYSYPWTYVKEYFQNDDITIGNLETSITRGGSPWPNKQFNFRSDPENIAAMKKAGMDIVSLANNHTLDYGYEGLEDTLNYLKEGNLSSVGAGMNKKEAMDPVIIKKDNIKIGILGFSRVVPHVGWWATAERPGLLGAYDSQLPEALELIEKVREEVDILISLVHWGSELHEEARDIDVVAARRMIDSGVDVIVGHHPHVVQGIEIYEGKPIFYSLGNFIFTSRSELTRNTMIAQLDFKGKELEKIDIIPFEIVNSRPESVNEEMRVKKLDYLRGLSSKFGTIIDNNGIISFQ